jgi:hypothetical protein
MFAVLRIHRNFAAVLPALQKETRLVTSDLPNYYSPCNTSKMNRAMKARKRKFLPKENNYLCEKQTMKGLTQVRIGN